MPPKATAAKKRAAAKDAPLESTSPTKKTKTAGGDTGSDTASDGGGDKDTTLPTLATEKGKGKAPATPEKPKDNVPVEGLLPGFVMESSGGGTVSTPESPSKTTAAGFAVLSLDAEGTGEANRETDKVVQLPGPITVTGTKTSKIAEETAKASATEPAGPAVEREKTPSVTNTEDEEDPDFPAEFEDIQNPGFLSLDTLRHIAGYVNAMTPASGVVPISAIPASGDFGSRGGGGKKGSWDPARFFEVDGKRTVVGVLGRITNHWFHEYNGNPTSPANMGVVPLRVRDLAAYNRLCNMRSMPPRNEEREKVWASRLMTVRQRGVANSKIMPFTDVLDGQTTDVPVKREGIDATSFGENDIVLMRCYIVRYPPKGEATGNKWTSWTTTLELKDIVYLYRAPDVQEDPEVPADAPAKTYGGYI